MILTGAIANGLGVVICGFIGSKLRKGIPQRVSETIMQALSLVVIFIGISGTFSGHNALITIVSLAIGTVIGHLVGLDRAINRLGDYLQRKFSSDGSISITDGFVSASLLICVGAMAIIGSLESGLSGNHSTLLAKSVIDAVATLIMATTLGIGVALSGFLVFIYEAAMTFGAGFIQPYLTQAIIDEMACVGAVTIICIGFNMMGISKIKVMNMVPGIFLPILLGRFL